MIIVVNHVSFTLYYIIILLSSVTIIMLLILCCAEQFLLRRHGIRFAVSYHVTDAIYRMTMNYSRRHIYVYFSTYYDIIIVSMTLLIVTSLYRHLYFNSLYVDTYVLYLPAKIYTLYCISILS